MTGPKRKMKSIPLAGLEELNWFSCTDCLAWTSLHLALVADHPCHEQSESPESVFDVAQSRVLLIRVDWAAFLDQVHVLLFELLVHLGVLGVDQETVCLVVLVVGTVILIHAADCEELAVVNAQSFPMQDLVGLFVDFNA